MEVQINSLEMGEEFKICPSCGYKDGFHSMLKKEGGKVKWMFICPSCHEVFDIGYRIEDFHNG
ncbi:hypothetical protein [Desulfospira joergensenii]|uniref:hypothetical protein n=1 Tax=Desulfospira joergensenii TaxID=53329 RepID=UPI0003B621CE|nr:hypothetical protein [Desulfospira joergensenii]